MTRPAHGLALTLAILLVLWLAALASSAEPASIDEHGAQRAAEWQQVKARPAGKLVPVAHEPMSPIEKLIGPELAGHTWKWVTLTDGRDCYFQIDAAVFGGGYVKDGDAWRFADVLPLLTDEQKTELRKGPRYKIEWKIAAPPPPPPPSRILLVFGAEWCGPCQAMRPDRLAVLSDGWDVRFVDIDQRPDLAGYFGVQSVPCSVVVESAGTQWGVVARVVGRIPRAQLLGLAIVHGVGKRKG